MAPYHCHHASVSVSSDVIKNRDLGIRQIQPYPCNLERGSCWASHLTLILCFLIWNRDGSYECYMSGDLLPAWHWAWPRQGLDRIHCDCGAESKGAYMPLLQITGHSTLCAGQTPTWYFYWGPLASLLKSDDNCGKEGTKSSQAQLVSSIALFLVSAKALRTDLSPHGLAKLTVHSRGKVVVSNEGATNLTCRDPACLSLNP